MDVTEVNFENFIKDDLVLIFFWETWCGLAHDQIYMHYLDDFEKESGIKVGKMNLSENSFNYQIKILPTYMFFKEGRVVKTLFGVQTTQYLKDAIKSLTR